MGVAEALGTRLGDVHVFTLRELTDAANAPEQIARATIYARSLVRALEENDVGAAKVLVEQIAGYLAVPRMLDVTKLTAADVEPPAPGKLDKR